MIKHFRHKGLNKFLNENDKSGIPARHANRIARILSMLNVATNPQDMNLPGWDFHGLKGNRKGTYSVTVSGNFRITFCFNGTEVTDVNYENYHDK